MKHISIAILILATLPIAPVGAVNKCVSRDGSVSYQAAPCPAEANTIEMQKLPQSGPSSDPSEVARIKDFVEKSNKERRLLEIDREIAQSEDRIASYRQVMNAKVEALRVKKSAANNNLAGAAWEQSISSEMSAISQQYDALIRSEQDRMAGLRDEAKSLHGTK